MNSTKSVALLKLREKLQAEYEVLLSDNENISEKQMARVKLYDDIVQMVEKSAEWPFQTNAIYRLISTVIFPFLFVILDWIFTLVDVGGELFSF